MVDLVADGAGGWRVEAATGAHLGLDDPDAGDELAGPSVSTSAGWPRPGRAR